MGIFRIDMHVVASAYIRADNEQAALDIAKNLRGGAIGEDVPISGVRFDDPDLPDVSVSPVMTIYDPTDNPVEEVFDGR